jgi:bifunctional DNase/RNase
VDGQTFVEAEIWTVAQTDQGNVVLVRPKGSDLAVPIFIGQLETQSILIGMGRVEVPRPLTHDLLLSMIATFGAELSRVEICDLRDGTFYARIILQVEGRDEILVDSRPSDAIGISVRANCPVFIAESVVEEAGISVNLVTGMAEGEGQARLNELPDALPEPPLPSSDKMIMPLPPESEAGRLRAELESAVADENYERAASLRDRLRDLEG